MRNRLSMTSMAMAIATFVAGCQSGAPANGAEPAASTKTGAPFVVTEFASFEEPWAMTFLPDGRLVVTEKKGALRLFDPVTRKTGTISGTPQVAYGGQGGLGDVVLHPQFAQNGWVYLSYAEAGDAGKRGAAVMRAKLTLDANGGGALSAPQVIWRQTPKVEGGGHYSHRLVFAPDGKLFISSGERQKFDPAQDMQANLGKVIRVNDDGTLPADNPFAAQGGVAAQVWTLGHRNLLGLAFHPTSGQLYEHEMGPKGGDEFNVIERGKNYGYPIVSNGDHYDGRPIPDHDTAPQYRAPLVSWTPVISPSSLIFYTGTQFPQWKNDALIGGLSSQALVRVRVEGQGAREVERYPMSARIREVEQGPDGAVWLLQDAGSAKLLKLTPAK